MPDELFSVADKVVFVSGGTRGIGRAIAEGFCNRGAKVVVTGREEAPARQAAQEIAALGTQTLGQPATCLGLACDVADGGQINSAVEAALRECGRIDVLVNVAGVNRRMPAEMLAEDDFDYIMGVNFRGSFLLSQAVGKHMLARGQGNQINVASLNNFAPLHSVMPYAASKAAVGHMTRALAMEWGPRGVRVNAIAPGFVLTDLTRGLWSQPVMQEWGRRNTPLVRLGEPGDMVGTAIFLASEASAFMTGQVLFVDGGFSAGLRWPIEEATQPSAT